MDDSGSSLCLTTEHLVALEISLPLRIWLAQRVFTFWVLCARFAVSNSCQYHTALPCTIIVIEWTIWTVKIKLAN